MRERRNGFTSFMRKLDGVEDKIPAEVNTSRFHVPTNLWYPETMIPKIKRLLRSIETTGDLSDLLYAFNWESTPQGRAYWERIYGGSTVIDREGLDYLHWLTEQE